MAISPDLERTAVAPEGRDVRPWTSRLPELAGGIGAALLVVLLARPMLFTVSDRGWDWYTHLWYIWHQSGSLRANGVPSLFLHDTTSVFSPHFAFYGGTLYAATGALTLAVGSVEVAYAATYLLAFVAAYGGWLWLGRMARLGPWSAHAPAVLFITSPYYLVLAFVRGDWAEFMAVSMIPLLTASALSVLRADRLRPLPALALAVSCVVFVGSHNLTLLWGTTVLAVVAVALLLGVPAARSQVTRRGLLRVSAVMLPAALVNAWFLVPDIAYQSYTYIGATPEAWRSLLQVTDHFVDWDHLLSLGRASADPGNPNYALQLPVLAIAWAVLCLPVLRPRGRATWVRTLLVLVATIAALIVVMTSARLMLALPAPYGLVQFSFRLESYILLAVSGAVLVGLVLADASSRRLRLWAWGILPILVVSVVQGAREVDMHRTRASFGPPLSAAAPYFTTAGVAGVGDYAGHDLPELAIDPSFPRADFPTSAEHGDRASVTVDALPGQLLVTNAMAVPQLVHLEGARFIGVDLDRHNVVELASDVTPGAAKLTLSAAQPLPVVLGRLLSLLGLAGLAADAAAMLLAWRRRTVGGRGA